MEVEPKTFQHLIQLKYVDNVKWHSEGVINKIYDDDIMNISSTQYHMHYINFKLVKFEVQIWLKLE